MSTSEFFAVCARGLEPAVVAELTELGAADIVTGKGGVTFRGDLRLLYRANLCLRSVSRILKPLREFAAANEEMLYSQTRRVRWEDILSPTKTIAVYATQDAADKRLAPPPQAFARGGKGRDVRGPQRAGRDPRTGRPVAPRPGAGRGMSSGGPGLVGINTQFMALKIKDAICDRLRREQGARPNVDTLNPQFRIHAHFAQGRCSLSIDSSGQSLHERGYRIAQVPATLKETLACGLLRLGGYDTTQPLWDPMCGSGTLVVEAALRALRIAPGLFRTSFAFQEWPDFDGMLWTELVNEIRAQRLAELPAPIFASDISANAVEAARINAKQAGVDQQIHFFVGDATVTEPPCPPPALIVTNPPYGERMGSEERIKQLYEDLAIHWSDDFKGWKIAMFAANLPLARGMAMEAVSKHALNNGPLSCRLLMFDPELSPAPIDPKVAPEPEPVPEPVSEVDSETAPETLTATVPLAESVLDAPASKETEPTAAEPVPSELVPSELARQESVEMVPAAEGVAGDENQPQDPPSSGLN
jgi:putative N6-adenine-specific DNA methylase